MILLLQKLSDNEILQNLEMLSLALVIVSINYYVVVFTCIVIRIGAVTYRYFSEKKWPYSFELVREVRVWHTIQLTAL